MTELRDCADRHLEEHESATIDAIFLAVERDAWGEVFNVTDGSTVTCREYFDRLTAAAGLRRPWSLPAAVLRPTAYLLSGLQRLLGRRSGPMLLLRFFLENTQCCQIVFNLLKCR